MGTFYSKIAGVTYSNTGTNTQNRQRIIAELVRRGQLENGTELHLQRMPDNPYDCNAVAVLAPDGRQLGFLPRDIAQNVSPRMRSGTVYRIFVEAVTGGDADSYYGVNIKIVDEDNKATVINNQEIYKNLINAEASYQGIGHGMISAVDIPNGRITLRLENGREHRFRAKDFEKYGSFNSEADKRLFVKLFRDVLNLDKKQKSIPVRSNIDEDLYEEYLFEDFFRYEYEREIDEEMDDNFYSGDFNNDWD